MTSPWKLAIGLLVHDMGRLTMMAVSVAVGVVIVFLQLGLLEGILDSQSLLASRVRGDLLVMNRARIDLHHWDTLPPEQLTQIRAIDGVDKVTPIYEDHVGLTDPDDKRVRRVIVYAFPAGTSPIDLGDNGRAAESLRLSQGFVFDTASRPIYGKITPGSNIEIDKFPLPVIGLAHLGADIVNDGNIFFSEGEWLARRPDAQPIMGVVKLSSGASAESVRQAIYSKLDSEVVALTPRETRWREIASTLRSAPIGFIFGLGVLAGAVIGAINGYQVLYTFISDHLDQFAALKAIGISDGFLHKTILVEAMIIAILGFLIGLPTSAAVDAYVKKLTLLPIGVHLMSGGFVALITICTCAFAGRCAMRRVDAADPASLF